VVAMGHLYALGASTSDSEREIQVGNLAGYDPSNFNDYFSYFALGHIHRPQNPGNTKKIIYSGSPIPLSFSEKSDEKRVVIYDFSEGNLQYKNIKAPETRKLIRITGTYKDIHEKLMAIQPEDSQLPALIEIEMIEEKEDPQKVAALEELISGFNHPNAEIVKHRVQFNDVISGTDELYDTSKQIEELNPGDVFEKKMERSSLDENQKNKLKEAFHEILESIYQSE
jgi:exonuclease SbcD